MRMKKIVTCEQKHELWKEQYLLRDGRKEIIRESATARNCS